MTGLRKRYLFLVTAVALVGLMAIPGSVLAGARIQDEGRGTVSLNSVGDAPEQATAVARFTVSGNGDGVYNVRMRMSVRNLPKRAGRVFQTWLVDSNDGEGFNNAFGAFQTDNDGDASITTNQRMNFFAPFNEIIVTSEDRNDENPGRDGEEVLQGTME